MPLYDFKCTGCAARGEIRLSQFDSPLPDCEFCGAPTEKLVSAPSGFHLHGVGTFDKGYVSKVAKS